MRIDQLVDAMVQGIEQAAPEAVFGRLNPGSVGFRAQLNGEVYAVRIERLRGFNWDAPVIEEGTTRDRAGREQEQSEISAYFQPSGIIDEENAEWLHSLSWGGLPEGGDGFMEYMSWYDLSRAEQREAAKDFMEYPRARHMPAAVKDHLIALGLVDDERVRCESG